MMFLFLDRQTIKMADVDVPLCLLVRVIIMEDNKQKLTLPSRLESVHDLEKQIREKFELRGEFKLQYMNPDFDNQFMSLISTKDIVDRGTVKVVKVSVPDSESEADLTD